MIRMKHRFWLFTFLLIFSIQLFSLGNSFGSGCIKLRCVSLRALQNEVKTSRSGDGPSPELLRCANISSIRGYVVDELNDDIILLGKVDSSLPAIELENLAVALRCAWNYYRPYENPMCSIDPDPDIIQQLQKIGDDIFSSRTQEQVEQHLKEWHRTCRSPQDVRVLGIPFHSRFAQIMVEADYYMKTIVDGSEELEIPNFSSLVDMYMDKVRKDFSPYKPLSMSLSMNRFWFYPGPSRYDEDEEIVMFRDCPVILLTEEAHKASGNMKFGSGMRNPLAQKLAEQFSANYDEVAHKRPIYYQLKNLFSLVALANILKYKSSEIEAESCLSYLLNDLPIEKYELATQLPGRSNEKRVDLQGDDWKAIFWLPSCGGVDMKIRIDSDVFDRNQRKDLSAVRIGVLEAKPSPNAIYWDHQITLDSYLEKYGILATIEKINSTNHHSKVIVVEYTPTGFIARDGTDGTLYEGDDKAAFLKAVYEKYEQNIKLFLVLKGFPNELKMDAFRSAVEIQKGAAKKDLIIVYAIHQLQNYLLSEVVSLEIVSTHNLKGRGEVELKGELRDDTGVMRVLIKIRAKSYDFIRKLADKLNVFYRSEYRQEKTLSDIIDKVILDMKLEHELEMEELQIEIENECGWINVVDLNKRNIETAA